MHFFTISSTTDTIEIILCENNRENTYIYYVFQQISREIVLVSFQTDSQTKKVPSSADVFLNISINSVDISYFCN